MKCYRMGLTMLLCGSALAACVDASPIMGPDSIRVSPIGPVLDAHSSGSESREDGPTDYTAAGTTNDTTATSKDGRGGFGMGSGG